MTQKKPTLGRGLADLLGQTRAAAASEPGVRVADDELARLPLDLLQRGRYQPRLDMRPESLAELAESIRAQGVVQPIVVRPIGETDERGVQRYEIIAGERRWRAAQLAGLRDIPAVVRRVPDEAAIAMALIENIQREDLNPIETAHAFERLGRDLGLSQEEIGRRTGKDRTSIANIVRLLKLPREVQLLVAERRLSMGHARAILGLPTSDEQIQLAEKTVALGLSVRQVETQVQEMTADRGKPASGSRKDAAQDPNVRAAAEELERALGTRVRIVELSEQRGRIEIEYYSQADLDRLYQQIVGGK